MKTQILMILVSSMALTSECFAGGGSVGDGYGIKYCFNSEVDADLSPQCSGQHVQKSFGHDQEQFCCVSSKPEASIDD